ncbi:hypothetical protein SprV_0200714000 [Sparganum proliferum]
MEGNSSLVDATVYESKLPDEQQKAIAQIAVEALEKTTQMDEICKHIKHQLEDKYGNTWCCACGSQFSTCVSCVNEDFMHFHLGHVDIVAFRV